MRLSMLLLSCLLGTLAWPDSRVAADYYTYTDQNGVFCMTNSLSAVPPKARSTMKVVREEKQRKKELPITRQPQSTPRPTAAQPAPFAAEDTADRQTAPPAETKPASAFEQLSGRLPWLKPLLVVCGICGGILLVTKIAALLPSPQLARVLYLAFFLGIFVFGYKLYADHLVKNYFLVKTRILRMFTATNVRQAPETGEPPEAVPFAVKGQETKDASHGL